MNRALALLLRRGQSKTDYTGPSGPQMRGLQVFTYEPEQAPAGDGGPAGAVVEGKRVAIFNPPILLNDDGQTLPGMTRDLVGRYLVATTMNMAEAVTGQVHIEWTEKIGRFVNARFRVVNWNQQFEVVHPVAPISQELANVWETYMRGMTERVRQLHRAHQRYEGANTAIDRAITMLTRLRDHPVVQFSQAEYTFLYAAFTQAKVLSALVPVESSGPEPIVGTQISMG